MTFREIKICGLLGFINSDFYKSNPVTPISPQRAISQSNNPDSKDDDVALILALDDNETIVGYIGILPGQITLEEHRYFWNSCWWVDPEKGKMVAIPLFYKMLKVSQQKMVFFELTETTKPILEQLKFKTTTTKGLRCFLQFNSTQILIRKNKNFKFIKPLLFVTDKILNAFNNIWLSIWKHEEHISFYSIQEIDDEAEQFINQFNNQQLIPINAAKVNWILKYPWIKTNPTPEDKSLSEKYFFSSLGDSFSNELIKVYHYKRLIGVLFFTIRDGEMKLPYAFFDEQKINLIVSFIYEMAIKHQVISFTIFNSILVQKMKQTKNPFIFNKSIAKHMAFPKDLDLKDRLIQDGDGDAVFC